MISSKTPCSRLKNYIQPHNGDNSDEIFSESEDNCVVVERQQDEKPDQEEDQEETYPQLIQPARQETYPTSPFACSTPVKSITLIKERLEESLNISCGMLINGIDICVVYRRCLETDVFFIDTACQLLEKMKNSIFFESNELDILLDAERVSEMLI